jgi:signal transduction histidine kinase
MRKLTIRFKITLWYASLLLVLLIVFNVFMYIAISRISYQNMEELLKADADQVVSILQSAGYNIYLDIPYKIIATNTYFVVFDLKGNTGLRSELLPEIVDLPIKDEQIRYIYTDNLDLAIYDKPLKFNGDIIGWVRVGRSLQPLIKTLGNLKLIILISTPLYILFASLGGWFLAQRALRPIDYITKTAREIRKGNLTQRLMLPRTEDEVGRLATTFDEMLDKLESSISKEKRFASDASHELRTPVSIISAQVEQTLSGNKRSERDYRQALKKILMESKKMSYIISQLLMFYRGDEGKYELNFEILDLNMIVEEVANEFKGIASDNGIEINFEVKEKVKIRADQTLITRLLINLIDNAIRFSKKDGKVNIVVFREKDFANIIVEDNGIGISKKDIPYIFDRFYRSDRSRTGQGTGLGLSIVKWIVDMHKGEIKVESEINRGSRFIVKLPLF